MRDDNIHDISRRGVVFTYVVASIVTTKASKNNWIKGKTILILLEFYKSPIIRKRIHLWV